MSDTTPIRAVLTRAEGDGAFTFTAATAGTKRDGLSLDMAGAQVDDYLRNPVVLWAHDYYGTRLPIGRTAGLRVLKKSIKARIVFDMDDPFAAEVARKYEDGFLNTVSIGWNIIEVEGRNVTKWDLLDISAVPVPGDPAALIERQAVAVRALGESLLDPTVTLDDPDATLRAVFGTDEDEGEWLTPPSHVKIGGFRSGPVTEDSGLPGVASDLWRLLRGDGTKTRLRGDVDVMAAALVLKDAAQQVIDAVVESGQNHEGAPVVEPAPDPPVETGTADVLAALAGVLEQVTAPEVNDEGEEHDG